MVLIEGYTKKKNKRDAAGPIYSQGVIFLVRIKKPFLSGN